MSHRSYLSFLTLGLAVALMACNKKEAPAIIEEAPAAAAPVETDTSATLAEEPDLQQVGQKSSNNGSLNPSPSAETAGFSQSGSFVVQVSVFKSSRQAAGLVEKLAAQGYPAYVAEVESPTPELSGTYHRVRIGRFQRIADARAFGESTLRPAGYDFWVDNRKNDAVGGGGGYSSESYTPAPAVASPVEEYRPAEPAAPSEPSAPAGDAWGNPKADELPGATPPAETPPAAPAAASPTPAASDTGKVNLDEW